MKKIERESKISIRGQRERRLYVHHSFLTSICASIYISSNGL